MAHIFGAHITLNMDGYAAVVTINKPPHNYVSTDLLSDLADALEAADADTNCRASVVQAAGKNFCAGADFVNTDQPSYVATVQANPLYAQALRLFAIKKPMVAAVQGTAVGAGLGLALVADFRVAAIDARFSANFVKLGFHPGFGITHTLPRLIGAQRAHMMCLTGRRIKAEQACDWGLADEVVALPDLAGAALRWAKELADNAPLAVVATRATLRADLVAAVRAQTDREHAIQIVLRETDDFAEGVRAVSARRAGEFSGR